MKIEEARRLAGVGKRVRRAAKEVPLMASHDGKRGNPKKIDLEYRAAVIDRVRAAHPDDPDIVVVLHMARRWIEQRRLERERNAKHEASKRGRDHRGRRADAGAAAVERSA